MSVLSGPEIECVIRRTRAFRSAGMPPPLPVIDIDPFVPDHVGPNSVDLRLGNLVRVYAVDPESAFGDPIVLDPNKNNPTDVVQVPKCGLVLRPGVLYLGSTLEKTTTSGVVPWIDGRSSVGRLGVGVHVTAGRGDDGFGEENPGGCTWTLEITCVHPVRVYPGMRIAQITFMTVLGDRRPYRGRYAKQDGPTASRFWQSDDAPPVDNKG